MFSILIFLFVLSILVLVHELGHFLAAKKSGVKVEEFALGFPPNLYSYKKGETNYMINLIPFGGYVKMHGEDGTSEKDKNSFAYKKWYIKVFIVSAGVIMNLVLGAVLLAIVFMMGLPVLTDDANRDYPYSDIQTQVVVFDIPENHVLGETLLEGDKILSINDTEITSIEGFKSTIQPIEGDSYNMTIMREANQIDIEAVSSFNEEKGQWLIGMDLIEGNIVTYPFYLAIPMGVVEMFRMLWLMIVSLFYIVYDLVVSQSAPSQIAGPVGIYKLTAQASQMGISYLLQMMAILSVNLAIINFLPIPALDGGRIVFIIGERFFGKKISPYTENIIHLIGFVAIIAILILVTVGDVQKFF